MKCGRLEEQDYKKGQLYNVVAHASYHHYKDRVIEVASCVIFFLFDTVCIANNKTISDDNSSFRLFTDFWIQKMIPVPWSCYRFPILYYFSLKQDTQDRHYVGVIKWILDEYESAYSATQIFHRYEQPSEFYQEATSNYSHYHIWGDNHGQHWGQQSLTQVSHLVGQVGAKSSNRDL